MRNATGPTTSTDRHYRLERTSSIRTIQGDDRVIYAVRTRTGLIKIGCTMDLVVRVRHIKGGTAEILAFRPGELEDEAAIHVALKPYRALCREYYHAVPEVLAVVNELRTHLRLPPIAP